MKVSRSAGQFVVETWTDGSPLWVTVAGSDRDGGILPRFDFKEIYDLKYALDRFILDIEEMTSRR